MAGEEPYDDGLPDLGTPGSRLDSWMPEGPETTDLILLWPDEVRPTPAEVIGALERALDTELERDDSFEPDDSEEWVVAVDSDALAAPMVLWAEAARPLPDQLDLGEAAGSIRWVVGVETLLHPDDSLTSYINLVRLLAIALPHVPAMLDLSALTWRTRAQIESLFLRDEVEPPASVLWTVHTVGDDSDDADHLLWLHTHGLARCGRPELELLEVPSSHAHSAFDLLQSAAMLFVDQRAPAAGDAVALGPDATIMLQPLDEVLKYVAPAAPGSRADRASFDDETHRGIRAAICDAMPQGTYRKVWALPRRLLQHMAERGAILFCTPREQHRQSTMARLTWDQMATAFAAWMKSDQRRRDAAALSFGIKVGFTVPDSVGEDGHADREHMWVELTRVDGTGATGVLLNEPAAIATLTKGQSVTFDKSQITDWRVATPRGVLSPEQLEELWEIVDDLRRDQPAANFPERRP